MTHRLRAWTPRLLRALALATVALAACERPDLGEHAVGLGRERALECRVAVGLESVGAEQGDRLRVVELMPEVLRVVRQS